MGDPTPEDDAASPPSLEGKDFLSSSKDRKPLIMVFLGGVMFGVILFSAIFHPKFSGTLHRIAIQHNATLQLFQDRVDVAVQETQACLDDDTSSKELAELRAEFVNFEKQQEEVQRAQRELVEREARCESELEAQAVRILELKEETITREREYFEQKDSIDRQAAELESLSKERDMLHERTTRLSEQRTGLTKQLKGVSRQLDELGRKAGECDRQIYRFHNRIKQRENFLCREDYGNGPYYVEIKAKPRDTSGSTFSFVVELASRKHMPHSVFTFLSLVSYQMYDGTTFRLGDTTTSSGGKSYVLSLSMTKDVELSFEEKRKAVGMVETILMLTETSALFPCQKNSVGFQGLGPLLEFFLGPSPPPGETTQSCFGTVMHGAESLISIQKLITEGTAVDITHVEYLVLE